MDKFTINDFDDEWWEDLWQNDYDRDEIVHKVLNTINNYIDIENEK